MCVQIGFSITQPLNSPSITSTQFTEDGNFTINCIDNVNTIPNTVKGYILYIYDKYAGPGGEFFPIDTVNYSGQGFSITVNLINYTFSYYNNGSTIVTCNLLDSVYDFAIEAIPVNPLVYSQSKNNMLHNPQYPATNILLKANFYCGSTINLNWNKYYGWPGSQDFTIMYAESNSQPALSVYQKLTLNNGQTSITQTSVSYTPPITNKTFWFYIKATGEATSTSNVVKVTTNAPTPPDYMYINETDARSDTAIKLSFIIDPATQFHKYLLSGSEDNKTFNTIDTIKSNDIPFPTLPPYYFKPAKKNVQYYFKLFCLNDCNSKVDPSSSVESNIVLSYTYNNDNVNLSWTDYKPFLGTSYTYNIRCTRDNFPRPVNGTSLNSNITNFNDNVSPTNLTNKKLVEELYYYVEADETLNNVNVHAFSNIVKVTIVSEPTFPKVIVPNSNTPEKNFCINNIESGTYKLIIFDRWGTKVCETDDAVTGWNGRYANGNLAPQGMYMYYFKITADGKSSEFKGTFALVLK